MKFNKIVLENGLTILHEKRDVPVTTVMLAVKYGAAYENEKEKGIAHFIEHLCFKGTEKRTANQIACELEKVGGILNAFTSEQITAYHAKLPSEHLDIAMDVLFDIFFNPIFPEQDVKKESNVICEEIKMHHDNPQRHVLGEIKNSLYKKPFGMFIAGTEENIKNMDRNFLLEKHHSIYCPKNSVLCVVGNNDFEQVKKFAESFSFPKVENEVKIGKIELQNLQKEETRAELKQANLAIGFHFPKMSEEQRYAADIFTTILGEGMSSKLFTEVREKRGLVYSVKTFFDCEKDYGYLIIYAGTEKQKVEEVVKICLQEYEKMAQLSEEELEQGKVQVVGNKKVGAEESDNTALNLVLEEFSGKAEDFYEYEKNIKNVKLEDIKKLAQKKDYSYFILSP